MGTTTAEGQSCSRNLLSCKMSSLRLLSLMNAFEDEEEEKPQKLRGTVPKYPATGPLDEGSADNWMTWDGDFRTYAGINKLTKLLEPPYYGQVQLPPHIANGPQDPGPTPREPTKLTEDELKDGELVRAYELALENYKTMTELRNAYTKHMESIKDDMKNIWKPRFELYQYKQLNLRLCLQEAVEANEAMKIETRKVDSHSLSCGTDTYLAMRQAATNPIGVDVNNEDTIEEQQAHVLGRITPMADTAAVRKFIDGYTVYYYNMWCKLFTPTPQSPTPWCDRVPETLIVKTISTNLPAEPTWDSFVQNIAGDLAAWKEEFKNTRCFPILRGYLKAMKLACNRVLRREDAVHANPTPAVGPNGKPLKCYYCVKAGVPEGPATAHLSFECPNRKKKNKTKRANGKSGGGGGRNKPGPSKNRPCDLCGAHDHWKADCPQKKLEAELAVMKREAKLAALKVEIDMMKAEKVGAQLAVHAPAPVPASAPAPAPAMYTREQVLDFINASHRK